MKRELDLIDFIFSESTIYCIVRKLELHVEIFLQPRKLICIKYKPMSDSIIPRNDEIVIEFAILYVVMATQKRL